MSETGVRVGVRRRRGRAEIEALVHEFESSGLTRQGYCTGRGLSVAALDKYRRRLIAASAGMAKSEGRLVPVEVSTIVPAGNDALSVVLSNGRRIEVSGGFDAAALRRLLGVLEQA